MPKKRLPQNRGLPERWAMKHGAYYYIVPRGQESQWDEKKWFPLGKTLHEAHNEWAKRLEGFINCSNLGQIIDRYMAEVAPAKSPKTYAGNQAQSKKIKAVFGDMSPDEIKPQHIYKYVDKRGAQIAARREIALLSHILTKAVEWGYADRHPFKGQVRLEGEKPRSRYIEDWEILECFGLSPLPYCRTRLIQAFMAFAIVSGRRKEEILKIKIEDIKEDGIHIQTNKKGRAIIIEWTHTLRFVTQQLLDQRPVDISPYLICNKRGECYYGEKGASGFDNIFKRFMDRAIEKTGLKERFTLHDLRAKCASDIKNDEDARKLLAHSSVNMTRRTYRRKPEKVSPLR